MSDKQYETRVTRLSILPKGAPLFSELCTHVYIDDEAAGEYVMLEQQADAGGEDTDQKVSIEPANWPQIRDAVERLLGEISEWEAKKP